MNSAADPSPAESRAEHFYRGAIHRILRILLVLTVLVTLGVGFRFGWIAAVGFAAGGGASWLNFYFLARGAQGLADRVVDAHSKERGGIVITRFLLRYVLVAVIAYVIFKSSTVAFRGFLCGLCLPVAAMLVEAVIEGYGALRRGY